MRSDDVVEGLAAQQAHRDGELFVLVVGLDDEVWGFETVDFLLDQSRPLLLGVEVIYEIGGVAELVGVAARLVLGGGGVVAAGGRDSFASGHASMEV